MAPRMSQLLYLSTFASIGLVAGAVNTVGGCFGLQCNASAAPAQGNTLLQVSMLNRASMAGSSSSTGSEYKSINGNPEFLGANLETCSDNSEKLAVRCCQAGAGKVFMKDYGCSDCSNCRDKTYAEAEALCVNANLHLCSLDEVKGDLNTCASSKSCSTGCSMNGERFWTSTVCTTTTTTTCPPGVVPNWQSWAALDDPSTKQCDAVDAGLGIRECYGNGDCICGTCVCRVGWRGPYCSQLDLLPADKGAPGLPMNSTHPSWGGAAVQEGGRWYFLSGTKIMKDPANNFDVATHWGRTPAYDPSGVFPYGPYGGSHPWEYDVDPAKNPFKSGPGQGNFKSINGSRDLYEATAWLSLYESTGADAAGPYTESVSKMFKAFRADLKTDVSGSLLMLSNAGGGFTVLESRTGQIAGPWFDGTGSQIDELWMNGKPGHLPTTSTRMPKPVYKFIDNGHCSLRILTPGSQPVYAVTANGATRACTQSELDKWNCKLADPALLVLSSGKTIIAYRGTKCNSTDHKERIGLLVSDSGWQGPYDKVVDPILEDHEVQAGGLEDLFMWASSRGVHMVVHSQATDHSYDASLHRSGFHHKKKRGAYLFSRDGVNDWALSDWELFPSEIRWSDDTTQFLLKQQRPSIIFDTVGNPTHLITGVDYLYDPCCDWYGFGSAWTLVQPVVTDCRAGQVKDLSGACTRCSASTSEYNGRCETATTKYGECVCAECKDGWSGDLCDCKAEATIFGGNCGSALLKFDHCVCTACQNGYTGDRCQIAPCLATNSEFNGNCATAGMQIGQCVCTACTGGYSGNLCDVPPPITCATFTARKQCQDLGDSDHVRLGGAAVISGSCLQECQATARAADREGCCFQNRARDVCRFYPGQQIVDTNRDFKDGAICERR